MSKGKIMTHGVALSNLARLKTWIPYLNPPHHLLMLNSERAYVDLIFRATKKYPAWDPEVLLLAD
jgi:hypothetical protein